jgi:hypothetical protein
MTASGHISQPPGFRERRKGGCFARLVGPFLEDRSMPTLTLTAREMDLVDSLTAPIDPSARDAFRRTVAAELEASRRRGTGEGEIHRIARTAQRAYFDPPEDTRLGVSASRRRT